MEQEKIYCADCGREITAEELADENYLCGTNENGEEIYICADCEDDWSKCYECGNLCRTNFMAYCESNGEDYCKECAENCLEYCERCGNYYLAEETNRVNTHYGAEYWCEDCIEEYAFFCDDCEEYYDCRYYNMYETRDGRVLCGDCITDGYYYCEGCDSYVSEDDWDYDEQMCTQCAEERGDRYGDRRIKGYHDAPCQEWYGKAKMRWRMKRLNQYKPVCRGLGFELEVGNGEYFEECIDDIETAVGDRVYFEHDGSLVDGFEIISQPHTIDEFWKNKNRWSEMLQAIKDNGFTSHDTGFCGLHVHFSREMFGSNEYKQTLALAKILYFMQYYRDDIKKISRRKNLEYCNFYDMDWNNQWLSESEIRNKWIEIAKDRYGDRYRIINNQNYATVEFRLFRGTLNEKSFFATFDFLQNIVKNAKTIKWCDVKDVSSWLKGMSKETLEYIKSRHAFEKVLANITAQDEENYIEEVA